MSSDCEVFEVESVVTSGFLTDMINDNNTGEAIYIPLVHSDQLKWITDWMNGRVTVDTLSSFEMVIPIMKGARFLCMNELYDKLYDTAVIMGTEMIIRDGNDDELRRILGIKKPLTIQQEKSMRRQNPQLFTTNGY